MKIFIVLSLTFSNDRSFRILGTIPRSIASSPKIHRCSSGNEVAALATQMSWQCATIPGSTAFWRWDFQEKTPNFILFCSSHILCIFKAHRVIYRREKLFCDYLKKSVINFWNRRHDDLNYKRGTIQIKIGNSHLATTNRSIHYTFLGGFLTLHCLSFK